MTIIDMMSNVTFLLIGSLGIYIHLKEPNYMALIGGIGIILVILSSIVDKKEINKKIINEGTNDVHTKLG